MELADRALAADPNDVDALLVRASLNNLAGRHEQALADLEQASRINPNHLGALQLLLQLQSRSGLTEQVEETKDRFRRARDRIDLMDQLTREIGRRSDDPEPRWRMGQAAIEGGLDTLAYQCFQAALDLDPNHQPSRKALAALRARGRTTPDTLRLPRASASAPATP